MLLIFSIVPFHIPKSRKLMNNNQIDHFFYAHFTLDTVKIYLHLVATLNPRANDAKAHIAHKAGVRQLLMNFRWVCLFLILSFLWCFMVFYDFYGCHILSAVLAVITHNFTYFLYLLCWKGCCPKALIKTQLSFSKQMGLSMQFIFSPFSFPDQISIFFHFHINSRTLFF